MKLCINSLEEVEEGGGGRGRGRILEGKPGRAGRGGNVAVGMASKRPDGKSGT